MKPFDSQISSVQEIQRHSSESEQKRILLERQREQSKCSLILKQRFENANSKPIMTEEVFKS